MTCDHTIGKTFNGDIVTIEGALEDAKISQMQTYKFTGRQEELKCWVVYRFEYCPHCGTKINWADIRRKFKEEQEI